MKREAWNLEATQIYVALDRLVSDHPRQEKIPFKTMFKILKILIMVL